MAINQNSAGLCVHGLDGNVAAALRTELRQLPPDAPVVVLIHGYKYDPALPASDPHRLIYALAPASAGWKTQSWPSGLGFTPDHETGLCIAFGWPAAHLKFGNAYAAARSAGDGLASLMLLIGRLAPDRPIDLFCHSLGARVVLQAIPQVAGRNVGRVILLGGAEFSDAAQPAVKAAGSAEYFNFTARHNDVYDALFERAAPRPAPQARALGAGLHLAPSAWVDLQMDHPEITAVFRRRGAVLHTHDHLACHWGFYIRPGAFDVLRGILRERATWNHSGLRQEAPPQEPRWSRFRLVGRTRQPHGGLPGARPRMA